jgi:hypothetical protein
VEQLQEAIKLCEQCEQVPVLHRNLGLIYARKRDLVRAKGELQLALRTHPQDTDAAKALRIMDRLPPLLGLELNCLSRELREGNRPTIS